MEENYYFTNIMAIGYSFMLQDCPTDKLNLLSSASNVKDLFKLPKHKGLLDFNTTFLQLQV